MAKEAGLAYTTFSIDDSGASVRTLVNDITNVDYSTPRGVQDITGMDKSAIERLLLLADYSASITAVFNDASNQMHDVFKTISSTSVIRTITSVISGQTLAVEAFLTDYPLTRASTGEFTATVPAVLGDGTAPTWT